MRVCVSACLRLRLRVCVNQVWTTRGVWGHRGGGAVCGCLTVLRVRMSGLDNTVFGIIAGGTAALLGLGLWSVSRGYVFVSFPYLFTQFLHNVWKQSNNYPSEFS